MKNANVPLRGVNRRLLAYLIKYYAERRCCLLPSLRRLSFVIVINHKLSSSYIDMRWNHLCIRPLLDYNCILWNPTDIYLIDLMENVQRSCFHLQCHQICTQVVFFTYFFCVWGLNQLTSCLEIRADLSRYFFGNAIFVKFDTKTEGHFQQR